MQYRSQYRYLGHEELADPAVLKRLSPFEAVGSRQSADGSFSSVRCLLPTADCHLPTGQGVTIRRELMLHAARSNMRCTAEARYIHYSGRNKHADGADTQNQGRDVYGYASIPDRLIDDHFACAWTLRTGLEPANMDERHVFPETFAYLQQRFPYLDIGEVLALWNTPFHRAGGCGPGLPGLPGPHLGSGSITHGGHPRRRGG